MDKKVRYHEICGCEICNCTIGNQIVDPNLWGSSSSNTTSTIGDFTLAYNTEKRTLETLIDSLSEEEWRKIKNRVESKKAHETSRRFTERKKSSIEFAEWILNHSVRPGFDENMNPRWSTQFGNEITYYTSENLYNIFITGEWEQEEFNWDSTLEDGLENL